MQADQIENLKALAPELRSAANLIRQWLKAIPGTTNWNDCAQANACDAAAEYFERLRAEKEKA